MSRKKSLRKYLLVSLFIHIAIISAGIFAYINDKQLTKTTLHEIFTIKVSSDNKLPSVANKPEAKIVQSNKPSFSKKPAQNNYSEKVLNNKTKNKINLSENETIIERSIAKKDSQITNNVSIVRKARTKDNQNSIINNKNSLEIAHPDYNTNPKPNYPLIARRRGYEGTVMLKVLVLEDGRVGKVDLEKSSRYKILDSAAIKAVYDWNFIPGKKDGVVFASWVKVPIKFQLN